MGKKKKNNMASNPFIEKLKRNGVSDIRITEDGKIFGNIDRNRIITNEYDPSVIQEGGLESYIKFIHKCLKLKGLGVSPETNYEWHAKSMMAWFDPKQPHLFPLFEYKPGRIEEPVYVFFITKIGDKPFDWMVAAEVEDILKGIHVKYERYLLEDFTGYVQAGILDVLNAHKSSAESNWHQGFQFKVLPVLKQKPESKG